MIHGKRDLLITNNIEIEIELKKTGINNPTSPWTTQNKKLDKIIEIKFPWDSVNLRRITPLKNISSMTGTQTQIAKRLMNINSPSPKIYLEIFGKYIISKLKKNTISA